MKAFFVTIALFAFLFSISSFAQVADFERDRLPINLLAGPWKFHTGDDLRRAARGFDDSAWPSIRADKGWDAQGYKSYKGFGWYRLQMIAPGNPEPLAIYLPDVANSYQLNVNGQLVGSAGGLPPSVKVVSTFFRTHVISAALVKPGQPVVIAIRVWRWSSLDRLPGSGLLAPPLIGNPAIMSRLRMLDMHHVFWTLTDHFLNLVFNLLTAVAALALFLLRRKEREYLWFGIAQVLWATQGMVLFGVQFLPLPFIATGIFQLCTKAGAQLLNLEFFVTLMGQRKGRLYWIAATAALLPIPLMIAGGVGLLHMSTGVFIGALAELVYGVCIPALLYCGATHGDFEARLLLFPFTLSFAVNVAGGLLSFSPLANMPWAESILAFIMTMTNRPFPISLYNVAGNLAMFSVIAVLILRYARSRRDEERLESELAAARAVQHVLIPEKLPNVPGYQFECVYKPAGQVGGDFFQIIPLADGEALVVIGDVSGKGMPAAMTVSMLVGIVRTLAQVHRSPAAILAAMNQNLMDRTFGGFTTCLILHIDAEGCVSAANAGHIAPYVNGREVPVENGLPLGLTAAASYTESTFQLSPDEHLTLLTDGVLEARKADGELFGFARAASISAQPAAEIARAAEQFGQNDDITVLSLQRHPSTEPSPVEHTAWSSVVA